MDATYVKQSSFDKLTAGWFNWEETSPLSKSALSLSVTRQQHEAEAACLDSDCRNMNVAPLVNSGLTSATLTQINTKTAQLISALATVGMWREKNI